MTAEQLTVCFIVGMFGGAVFSVFVGWLIRKAFHAAIARGLNW